MELPRAQAEVATRKQDLTIALANLRQREDTLKEALVRTPDPAVEAAEIVPLDRIQIPDTDDLPPLRQLVATAMAKRPDVAVSNFRDQTAEMALAGTENPLLPSLRVTAQTYNRGVAGTPQAEQRRASRTPIFRAAMGRRWGRSSAAIFRTTRAGVSFSIPIGNRTAQGDYGIDQLQFRQSQVMSQRDINNIVVDISARMSALRQARARYSAALNTRACRSNCWRRTGRSSLPGSRRSTTSSTTSGRW